MLWWVPHNSSNCRRSNMTEQTQQNTHITHLSIFTNFNSPSATFKHYIDFIVSFLTHSHIWSWYTMCKRHHHYKYTCVTSPEIEITTCYTKADTDHGYAKLYELKNIAYLSICFVHRLIFVYSVTYSAYLFIIVVIL